MSSRLGLVCLASLPNVYRLSLASVQLSLHTGVAARHLPSGHWRLEWQSRTAYRYCTRLCDTVCENTWVMVSQAKGTPRMRLMYCATSLDNTTRFPRYMCPLVLNSWLRSHREGCSAWKRLELETAAPGGETSDRQEFHLWSYPPRHRSLFQPMWSPSVLCS